MHILRTHTIETAIGILTDSILTTSMLMLMFPFDALVNISTLIRSKISNKAGRTNTITGIGTFFEFVVARISRRTSIIRFRSIHTSIVVRITELSIDTLTTEAAQRVHANRIIGTRTVDAFVDICKQFEFKQTQNGKLFFKTKQFCKIKKS